MATAAVLALLAGACAHPGPTGVKVKGFDADLVFGVKEPPKATTPANVGSTGTTNIDPSLASGDLALPPQTFASLTPAKHPAVSNKAANPCPDAALNAFPAEQAPIHMPIDRRPKVGVYRWKKGGTETKASIGTTIGIRGFEQRLVRNVKEIGRSTNVGTAGVPGATNPPGAIYSFETVQPTLDGTVKVTTWKVDTSPQSVSEYPGNGAPDARAGGPERGITIKSIQTLDSSGKQLDSFNPSSALLLLPLDVHEGEQFQSAAVDPATGQTYDFQGQVKPRQRVDACGTIIDGWPVVGTMTISGGSQTTYDYTVDFGTQLGGIPIAESISQKVGGDALDLQQSIGQLDPDPPPSS